MSRISRLDFESSINNPSIVSTKDNLFETRESGAWEEHVFGLWRDSWLPSTN